MQQRPAIVLFDLDGTLIDSAPGIMAAMREIVAERGIPDPGDARLRRTIGPPLHTSFAELLGPGTTAAQADAATEEYRAHYAGLMVAGSRVYDGIEQLLDALAACDVTLAVATAKQRPLARTLLAGLGLAGRFAAIEGPLPRSLAGKDAVVAAALTALGDPDPATVVMVGDRHHDIEAANANGLRAIGVSWGFAEGGELAGADAIAASPRQLGRLLGV